MYIVLELHFEELIVAVDSLKTSKKFIFMNKCFNKRNTVFFKYVLKNLFLKKIIGTFFFGK